MKYSVKDMIGSLEHDELLKMKIDLEKGGYHLKKLVEDNISRHQKLHNDLCSVCSGRIEKENINNYTLVFGPESFKKKASFCGMDCMEYFITSLKKMKQELK